MTRDVIRLTISDLSQFAKTLRADLPQPPSHVELLGKLARAAGYQNYQHLRAENEPAPEVDQRRLNRALRNFDEQGLFANWPARTGMQHLCLWAVWARLPARREMTEREISAEIDAVTELRDAAQIRRSLVEMKLLTRNLDGTGYRRLEQPMPHEARVLLEQLNARAASGSG